MNTFNKTEAEAYEESLKSYRDLKNSLDTAFEEGVEQGIEQVALEMTKVKVSDELITKITKLSKEQLVFIKKRIK